MYITNINNFLLMCIILLGIICLMHIIFKIVHKNVYKKTEKYCFEAFVSVEQIYMNPRYEARPESRDKSYTCNSYPHGLLNVMNISCKQSRFNTPGWSKPLPAKYFGA